jgi:protein gp37
MTTSIEWTDETWNPVVGCSRVSAGCEHCYAERVAHRKMHESHKGLTVVGKHGPRWTGEVRFLPERLTDPFSWRKRRRVFVNSMSDLFHEKLSGAQIAAVFAVMAATPGHTYQVLTKRPARARQWFASIAEDPAAWLSSASEALVGVDEDTACAIANWVNGLARWKRAPADGNPLDGSVRRWPLPNVHLGVSIEDQATADERVRVLRDCPAAVHWISQEPQLGAIEYHPNTFEWVPILPDEDEEGRLLPPIRWIVIGGESGPGARPFDLAWARRTLEQTRRTDTKCFIKQLGARPMATCGRCRGDGIDPVRVGHDPEYCSECGGASQGSEPEPLELTDRKGGAMEEWPPDLRVRDLPGVHT